MTFNQHYFNVLCLKGGISDFQYNIGIKHGKLMPGTEGDVEKAKGQGFQQLPRDLANINVLENNV